KSGKSGGSSTSDSTVIQSTTTVSSGTGGDSEASAAPEADYIGDGKCLENGNTVTCSEGEHYDKNGNLIYCIDGGCTLGLEEVEVIGQQKAEAPIENSAEQPTVDENAVRNLESAKKLSPDKFRKAIENYRHILDDPNSPEGAKESARYYLEILNQAAPSVFADQPCAKIKRELGLTISCGDWKS
ncbi:MAG: hypothetical protein ILA52_02885, partial [Alphaproteobacteria bacterium]|nr:hypothetical protein [Alphaproteobacteria bacterium]